MGWNGLLGNNGHVTLTQEEMERNRAESAQRKAEAEELFATPRAATDWSQILSVAVETAKEGDYSNEPKESPTDEDVANLLSWFGQRDEGMSFLTSFLSDRGWAILEDLWEIREALLLAQTAYLAGE